MATPTTKKPATKAAGAKPPAKAKDAAKVTPAKKTADAKPKTPKPEKPAKPEKAPRAPASAPTAGATLRAKDLVARVAEATGGKVKDVKPMVEATLAELGKSLDAGETLVLPPLGKIRITPAKEGATAGPMKLKLNRGGPGGAKKNPPKEGLAEDGEDS